MAIVSGSAGLVGAETVKHFSAQGMTLVGIDNDMRATFFGPEASTEWNAQRLQREISSYLHEQLDVRDRDGIMRLFARYGADITLVVHCAAQPSHDWAAKDPSVDFDINAVGTLNMLEATRTHCPDAVFIFTSTNKVYGDSPNRLPFVELDMRYEIETGHEYENGISEEMSIDGSLHSVFGASKVAADVMVQEFGRYFEMRTVCFRGGTLTGPMHSATELHGFLAYIMRCAMTGTPYNVYGYKGKQVRDAIHSLDLIAAFDAFFRNPRSAGVYNIGGGRTSNASVLEAISLAEEISGRRVEWSYVSQPRVGDHIWWIADNSRFMRDYPGWSVQRDVRSIMLEIFEHNRDRWLA